MDSCLIYSINFLHITKKFESCMFHFHQLFCAQEMLLDKDEPDTFQDFYVRHE